MRLSNPFGTETANGILEGPAAPATDRGSIHRCDGPAHDRADPPPGHRRTAA